MLFRFVVALAALAVGTEAQNTTPPPGPATATSTAAPTTHTVSVGFSGFKFTPNTTKAEVGDTIEFKFYPPDHSVIRGDFSHGCIPYEYADSGRTGFYSGPKFLNGIVPDLPTHRIKVNNTEPIFYYCGAKGSCMDQHMVGVVNPNDTWTLEAHVKFVEEAEFELKPGDSWPAEANPTTTASGYKPTSGGKTDSDKTKEEKSDSGHSRLSAGQIAGISIGAAAVVILGAAFIYLCGRRGGFEKGFRKSATPSYPPGALPVVEQKYNVTPKSPGNDWSTTSGTPAMGMVYPPSQQGTPPIGYNGQSPPLSPNAGYGPYSQTIVSAISNNPDGTYYNPNGTPHATPPPAIYEQQARASGDRPPVELPTSTDPGNSPLPNYQSGRQFSWAGGAESNYRPTKS